MSRLSGAAHHGVEFAGMRVDGDIGTFHVLPEKKAVHFQRRHSAFALHDPDGLDWPELLWYVPATHFVHSVCFLASANCPAAHGVHDAAPLAAAKVPAAQSMHDVWAGSI